MQAPPPQSPACEPVPPGTPYEAALGELERLVASMESGELPLDRLLNEYRRACALVHHCRGRLEAVEEQFRVLDQGTAKPWTPEAL
ncbi:exodeoxyribonuclease VII small subunit [Candidatus Symbiobacter mobilis]|uniref:Exodeoxyribonuclease 7 small subunit n=1 Tax=Candidatus Symbiobacter mobilis CR TaxID=946483 RepID=U5NB67_9BURK|nr:exodeoxyribonuclease VII small subunit [Candidatus Symbiobacter mobilis]AGX88662.1 exodeoxyribonuclease VII small subunit [Candidatus Symbiobacter mobilis CR]